MNIDPARSLKYLSSIFCKCIFRFQPQMKEEPPTKCHWLWHKFSKQAFFKMTHQVANLLLIFKGFIEWKQARFLTQRPSVLLWGYGLPSRFRVYDRGGCHRSFELLMLTPTVCGLYHHCFNYLILW